MKESICGIDCAECSFSAGCAGCVSTGGRPFGGECVVAACCKRQGRDRCPGCADTPCALRVRLLEEIDNLGISDMEKVTELYALAGSYINLTYGFPQEKAVRLLDDRKIYLGTQTAKKNSDRCYGIAADETVLVVSEYGKDGADAQLVFYKRR